MEKISLRKVTDAILAEEAVLRQGGNQERQKRLGRLTVRERLKLLLDPKEPFIELGLWAAYGMYQEWGSFPAAGLSQVLGKCAAGAAMLSQMMRL